MSDRNIIPKKIPPKIWRSQNYELIILYALKIYRSMSLQEFVNRGNIKNRFNENTFRKHATIIGRKGYIEVIRNKFGKSIYKITLSGDKRAKGLLKEYKLESTEKQNQLMRLGGDDVVNRLKNELLGQINPLYEQTIKNYEIIRNVRTKYLDHLPLLHELIQLPEEDKEIVEKETFLKKDLIGKFEIFTSALKKYYETTFRGFLRNLNMSQHENVEDEVFEYDVMSETIDKCPGCGSNKIEDHVIMIECQYCGLEYFKKDLINIEDKSEILSIQEKTHFLDSLFLDFMD
jgi:hypothetical protein